MPQELVVRLREIVGSRNVLLGRAAESYATGYRFGAGPVLAAVKPRSLVEMWFVAEACVGAGHILIIQAANTGLTGGSTPAGSYDRDVVIINTGHIRGIRPILGGRQVVCLAGSTLHELERALSPLGREPHSVIGSSCIGASVVGGICNNSGGALIQRGPAYTEYALYARVAADGNLVLCNRLGIQLKGDPATVLRDLEAGMYTDTDIVDDGRPASSSDDYASIVREVDAPGAARYNADPSRLFDASGSAGKLIVFAVRLDTFPKAARGAVFYIGTDDPRRFTQLRRYVLQNSPEIPISGEYIHSEAFDLADIYGKDTVVAVRSLGTRRLPQLFALKALADRFARRLGLLPLSDRLLQTFARFLPDHLPKRMRAFRRAFEHHLILEVGTGSVAFVRAYLSEAFAGDGGGYFECDAGEAERAMLHRFAVAGAAVRYRAIHANLVEDIVALDIALPRNSTDWFEQLPREIEDALIGKLYYGHFFCHVFHQDYVVKKGSDPAELEHRLLALMDARGAEYPAEHNVGHVYCAKPALEHHYRQLDPTNALNPGIGRTSRSKEWQ